LNVSCEVWDLAPIAVVVAVVRKSPETRHFGACAGAAMFEGRLPLSGNYLDEREFFARVFRNVVTCVRLDSRVLVGSV
jgi:hypothetical protein